MLGIMQCHLLPCAENIDGDVIRPKQGATNIGI